jgi:two-component system sensor histidine kinase GlrK
MSFWQPRSVLQLVLVGFFAALAPLCMAILFTVQTLGELADNSRESTQLVVEVTRLGQAIHTNLLELERRAGQYFALADPELADLFEREREILYSDLQTLQQRLPSDSPDVQSLLRSLEFLTLTTAVEADETETPSPAHRLRQSFQLINVQGSAVQTWLKATVDQLLKQNAEQAESLVDQLILQLAMLTLATLALLLFFTYWINKPVKDLTQEIHALATEGLNHSIEISGPQEVRELGGKLEW